MILFNRRRSDYDSFTKSSVFLPFKPSLRISDKHAGLHQNYQAATLQNVAIQILKGVLEVA